ncbi:unnamed protein product [Adineta steineri]|uniref:Uncharacterized protein n=1 Tax=Adineta steineri TaxID=433720 RepID=A0A815QYQ0_9BILA|nr:unnamed protein product [Adineta steineri]CAF1468936.1 unnamed protein product [Adineta steineri]CAF1601389.1 unnamed protein product [Adineta steineri]CAF1635185.1 unnamed protein product [Adineta steineri]
MSRLYSFKLHLSTENNNDFIYYMLNNNGKQNYMNCGYEDVLSIISTLEPVTYHIFMAPFEFAELHFIENIFPNIVFNYVIKLLVCDRVSFEHEFFQRISKAFPLLQIFYVTNFMLQLHNTERSSNNTQSHEIVEFRHLTSLNISRTDITYTEQFLNETKMHLPTLSELTVKYED